MRFTLANQANVKRRERKDNDELKSMYEKLMISGNEGASANMIPSHCPNVKWIRHKYICGA